ncbi:MAG: TIGR00341 family protein [Deltaproteobacteria bacterium]
MSLRLIESVLPAGESAESVRKLLGDLPAIGVWEEEVSDKSTVVKIVASAEDCENILDALGKRYSNAEGFRIVMLPVEATIPRPEESRGEKEGEPVKQDSGETVLKIGRISREELYADINESANITVVYMVLVVLSSVVASIGILKDNVAIIIGAMVIAPLLGPNMALAFGTTLGDTDLIIRALKSNVAGVAAALVFAVAIGAVFPVDPAIGELASRTEVGFGDIALALASGVAGTLSFTKGLPSALIGVMVAVALLPPTASVGMLLGSGHLTLAAGATQLLLVNVICVNLAAVSTFFIQGVRPLSWWEAEKAKKATGTAIIIWTILLLLLALTILLFRKYIMY